VSTLETKVIGVLARVPDSRTLSDIHAQLPSFTRTDVHGALARLAADGAIECLIKRDKNNCAVETWRLLYIPEREWNGMHVRMTLAGVTFAILGAGFVLLAAVVLWSMP
jgi:hypothetical protein